MTAPKLRFLALGLDVEDLLDILATIEGKLCQLVFQVLCPRERLRVRQFVVVQWTRGKAGGT